MCFMYRATRRDENLSQRKVRCRRQSMTFGEWCGSTTAPLLSCLLSGWKTDGSVFLHCFVEQSAASIEHIEIIIRRSFEQLVLCVGEMCSIHSQWQWVGVFWRHSCSDNINCRIPRVDQDDDSVLAGWSFFTIIRFIVTFLLLKLYRQMFDWLKR